MSSPDTPAPACPTGGCAKSKEYVSLGEAAVLREMRAVREQAREAQGEELEALRARFRELKAKLEQENLEKLRRLGHL